MANTDDGKWLWEILDDAAIAADLGGIGVSSPKKTKKQNPISEEKKIFAWAFHDTLTSFVHIFFNPKYQSKSSSKIIIHKLRKSESGIRGPEYTLYEETIYDIETARILYLNYYDNINIKFHVFISSF